MEEARFAFFGAPEISSSRSVAFFMSRSELRLYSSRFLKEKAFVFINCFGKEKGKFNIPLGSLSTSLAYDPQRIGNYYQGDFSFDTDRSSAM